MALARSAEQESLRPLRRRQHTLVALLTPLLVLLALPVAGHAARLVHRQRRGHEQQHQGGAGVEQRGWVSQAYALIAHQRELRGAELAALLHRGEHVARAQQQLTDFICDLLTKAAATGGLRADVAPDELASYCLHALTAASTLPSTAAVHRLVKVTLAGLRPADLDSRCGS